MASLAPKWCQNDSQHRSKMQHHEQVKIELSPARELQNRCCRRSGDGQLWDSDSRPFYKVHFKATSRAWMVPFGRQGGSSNRFEVQNGLNNFTCWLPCSILFRIFWTGGASVAHCSSFVLFFQQFLCTHLLFYCIDCFILKRSGIKNARVQEFQRCSLKCK